MSDFKKTSIVVATIVSLFVGGIYLLLWKDSIDLYLFRSNIQRTLTDITGTHYNPSPEQIILQGAGYSLIILLFILRSIYVSNEYPSWYTTLVISFLIVFFREISLFSLFSRRYEFLTVLLQLLKYVTCAMIVHFIFSWFVHIQYGGNNPSGL